MEISTKQKTINLFLEDNNLKTNIPLNNTERESIFIIEDAYYQIILEESSQFERLGQNPIWGITSELRDRVHTYTNASFANYIMGQHLAGEVLSRTTAESSLGLKYILSQDHTDGFASFIKNYINKENERIRKWKNTAILLNGIEKETHLEMANIRQATIDAIDNKEIWNNFEIDITKETLNWPNIFELFKQTGSELDYRTIYAMMCAQVHSDAGDIINRILARVLEQMTESKIYIENNLLEEKTFSLFMIQFGIRYFLDGLIQYSKVFLLSNSEKVLRKYKSTIDLQLKNTALELDKIRSPKKDND